MSDTTARCFPTHHRGCACIEAAHAAEVERLTAERDKAAQGLAMWRRHCQEAEAERDRLRDGIAAHRTEARRTEVIWRQADADLALWGLLDD